MRLIHDIDRWAGGLKGPVLTMGTFDGVHRGHQEVFAEVRRRAARRGGTSVALTFEPHPQAVLHPERAPLRLTVAGEKLRLIEGMGIEVVIVLPFTWELSRLTDREFVEVHLVGKVGVREVVIGDDHGFGRGRAGGAETLRALGETWGFETVVVPPVLVEGEPISSRRIRQAISEGDVAGAAELLGRLYSFSGRVVHGDGRGQQLGFPTANLEIEDPSKLLPADGVYVVWVEKMTSCKGTFGRRPGVMNIGLRPTFNGGHRSVEAHLMEFSADLYGESLTVDLVERIRGEMRFPSVEALRGQIEADRQRAQGILRRAVSSRQ